MRVKRASDSTTPSAIGNAPPDRLVPAPRGTIGTSMRRQICTIRCTCDSVSGSATASGRRRYADRPSHSYGAVSSSRYSRQCVGSTAISACTTSR